jgi:quercetin dioxygenase-like cupin family protein
MSRPVTKGLDVEIDRNVPATAGPRGSEDRFTGVVYMRELAPPDPASHLRAFDVYFTAGSRTAWHRHPHGQLLHVTEGIGRVGRRGGPVREINVGDTVRTGPGEWHWHGAAPASSLRHLSVQEADEDGMYVGWGEHVADADYDNPDFNPTTSASRCRGPEYSPETSPPRPPTA